MNRDCIDHINGNPYDNRPENLRWIKADDNERALSERISHLLYGPGSRTEPLGLRALVPDYVADEPDPYEWFDPETGRT